MSKRKSKRRGGKKEKTTPFYKMFVVKDARAAAALREHLIDFNTGIRDMGLRPQERMWEIIERVAAVAGFNELVRNGIAISCNGKEYSAARKNPHTRFPKNYMYPFTIHCPPIEFEMLPDPSLDGLNQVVWISP